MDKYIVVTTLSNNKKVLKNIQKELLNGKLAAGCQISRVKSSYIWNKNLHVAKEYKLELRTKKRLFKKVSQIIMFNHNYEVPEISYYYIYSTKEFADWIKNNTI